MSPVPLDVHLMIEDADRWAPEYAEAGAASVTFHAEATQAPVRLARELRSRGVRAGIALRPASPVEPLLDLLPELDMMLVMTVEPGFGGQSFIEGMLPKIRRARAAIDAAGAATRGSRWTAESRATRSRRIAAAGANVFVAGSAVYGAPDVAAEIARPARRWPDAGRLTGGNVPCGMIVGAVRTQHVLRGRCNSEPAVTVRDPLGPQGSGG